MENFANGLTELSRLLRGGKGKKNYEIKLASFNGATGEWVLRIKKTQNKKEARS